MELEIRKNIVTQAYSLASEQNRNRHNPNRRVRSLDPLVDGRAMPMFANSNRALGAR